MNDEQQLDLFAGETAEQPKRVPVKFGTPVPAGYTLQTLWDEYAALVEAHTSLQALTQSLQRRLNHMRISMSVFENITYVFGDEREGPLAVRCPACMHDNTVEAMQEPGARRELECKLCTSTLAVIFGFDNAQVIKVVRLGLPKQLRGAPGGQG